MNVIVCMPVKNCGKYLNDVFKNITKLKVLFKKLSVIFAYDDSKDNSLELLNNFKNSFDGDVYILLCNNNSNYRTHNIASARNSMINMINIINEKYFRTDFHIMMDSDDACSNDININILEKYLYRKDWDCLTFNRIGYYDIFALQYEPFVHHCWSFLTHGDGLKVVGHIREDIINKLEKLNDDELFECYSAFNGFAIYRTEPFLNIKYDGITQCLFSKEKINDYLNYLRKELQMPNLNINYKHPENCEHISFHLNAIRQNTAKIRITKECLFAPQ